MKFTEHTEIDTMREELEKLSAENEALKALIAELEPKPRYVDEFNMGDAIWIKGIIGDVSPDNNDGERLCIRPFYSILHAWLSDDFMTPENIRKA